MTGTYPTKRIHYFFKVCIIVNSSFIGYFFCCYLSVSGSLRTNPSERQNDFKWTQDCVSGVYLLFDLMKVIFAYCTVVD